MRIEHDFEYDVYWHDLSDEFCAHDSEYQANVLNAIGCQFKTWAEDKTKTATYIQLLEIAEQLSDNGKWFIETLHDYLNGEDAKEEKPILANDLANNVCKKTTCPYYKNPDYERCIKCEQKAKKAVDIMNDVINAENIPYEGTDDR